MAERTCVGCRSMRAKTDLIRFVCSPDGALLVDYRQRLPGRGVYTCVSRDCLQAALKRGGFARSFKRPMSVNDAELLQAVRQEVSGRILNLIGMARKAGKVVSGSNTVLQELGRPGAALLIVATDAAASTADKIIGRATGGGIPIYRLFDRLTLGAAIGRDERSHLLVTEKNFASNLIQEIERLKNIAGEN